MKKSIYILTVLVLLSMFMWTGCTEYAAGVGTGLTVQITQANKEMARLEDNIETLSEKSEELEIILASDPIDVISAFDPNLGNSINTFMHNLGELKIQADKFRDEKGKVDWEKTLGLLIIGLFSGGTGVNLYKNKKVQ